MSRTANPSKAPLGKVIQNAREALDITQDEMAAALSTTQQTVSRWESGQMLPGIDKLPKIAAVLKIAVEDLTGAAVKQAVEHPPTTTPTRIDGLENRLGNVEVLLEQIATRLGIAAEQPTTGRRRRGQQVRRVK